MEQVRAFVEGSEPVDYKPKDRASARHSRASGNDDLKKTITE